MVCGKRRQTPAAGVVLALLLGATVIAAATVTGLAACTAAPTTSTTKGCVVMTTEPNAATLRYAAHEGLRRAHEAADAEQTGIRLFTTFSAKEVADESYFLIVEGEVVQVDDPRYGRDHFSNDYVVFHVEPEQVLKGTPRFGTPVAFALPRGLNPPDGWRAVREGDQVLVFAGRLDESLVTGKGRSGAYLPWNDYFGLFLKVEDEYVNIMAPGVSTTADEVAAIVGPPRTSTTRGPGQVSFEGKTWRFEELAQKAGINEALPYRIMEGGEVAWLSAAAQTAQVQMTHAKGYELEGGDLIVLFQTEITPGFGGPGGDVERALRAALTAGAAEEFRADPGQVAMFWYGSFGYVMVADEYSDQLWRLGQWAETGAALR